MEAKYQARFEEQANNEKIIKQNMEVLQKYSETLEKERMNERQMRLKLEEEYLQNTKNHEEEVQLRLKFFNLRLSDFVLFLRNHLLYQAFLHRFDSLTKILILFSKHHIDLKFGW